MKWEVLKKLKTQNSKLKIDAVIDILLENREIEAKESFLEPRHPSEFTPGELGIDEDNFERAVRRIKKAAEEQEHVIIYGDYDADGICATAILWEALYKDNKNALPYIPDRFSEGYGLKAESLQKLKLKNKNLKLVITVDNGIVAGEAVDEAKKLRVDVIITDHHLPGAKLPKAHAIVHTTAISGSAISWLLARNISHQSSVINHQLELAALGTIADQLPLTGPNRSFAMHGLESLRSTTRTGLLSVLNSARTRPKDVGTYEVNFMIAPRINAAGRMSHGIEALRLLCTKNPSRASKLALVLETANKKRQEVVEEVNKHALETIGEEAIGEVIILADKAYHEGIIGLAAGRLAERFYRPAIVISEGEKVSKASARSISGFNIIEALREFENMFEALGGHPMAAGFSIKTENIGKFKSLFEEFAREVITKDMLEPRLLIDMELAFEMIDEALLGDIRKLEPFGQGNPQPLFLTREVGVADAKTVGGDKSHLSLQLGGGDKKFKAIAFKRGKILNKVLAAGKVDAAYSIEEDNWNGRNGIQLKIRDLKLN